MSRLPFPGGDEGVWAQILNDYLQVSHAEDGTLKANTVGSQQIISGSINDGEVGGLSQSKIINLQTNLSGLSGKNVSLVARAGGFIQNMLLPLTAVTSPSVIHADHVYDANYTGPVSGSFDLLGVSSSAVQLCPVVVSTPVGSIPDSYFGSVTGTITNFSQLTNGPYTVQAYKTTDTDYQQPASAAVNSGAFTLDLSAVPATRQGSWKFGLLDKNGNLVGQKWPSSTSYANLQLQHSVITDAAYSVASMPLPTTGTFSFPSTGNGMKQFQIVNTQTGEVMAEHVPPVQNVRSYIVSPGQPGYGTAFPTYSFCYDQAISLLAALAAGNLTLAKTLVAGLLKLQTSGGPQDGAFVFSAPQLSAGYSNPYYRTGTHAFAVYALLAYMEACPGDASLNYASAATRALQYFATVLSSSGATSGLYLGGTGSYSDPPGQPEVFNQSYSISWAATEHNLDTWHAFDKAATVLGDASYATLATSLKQNILTKLWDADHQRFYQGMQPAGPDPSDPLDMHTWGAIWLHNVGRDDLATQVMSDASLAPFVVTDGGVRGYAAAYHEGGYPGLVPAVWSEGTFGAALAFLAIGDTVNWQATIDGIAPGQQPDGSFRYVTTTDTNYQMSSSSSTIGAAWAILAALGHGIWGVAAPRG